MIASRSSVLWLVIFIVSASPSHCEETQDRAGSTITIEAEQRHLRTGSEREWSRFPATSEGDRRQWTFSAKENATASTLVIRQEDVRLAWRVKLNGTLLGQLQRDENQMLSHYEVPAKALRNGDNVLVIEGQGDVADDIAVGPIRLIPSTPQSWLHQATVQIEVSEADQGDLLPARLTIIDEKGSLVPLGAESNQEFAVRTGVIYTASGKATFGLPAGRYEIFANRGFEYGRADVSIQLEPNERIVRKLEIKHEVDSSGWIACDTHVHTVTHSGHGDATMEERMITLAGEGIEFPIATDHNKQIDYEPLARELSVRRYFTPVIGNEVTTKYGHFNAFPFRNNVAPPDHRQNDWNELIPAILATPDVQVVILNHGRDVHSGYRPFGPENFNEASGENLDGRTFLFNAMETLNSGAQQTDPLELFRDWMTLTNRGHSITPIGSSDSHDVNRYIVGQGRTYIRTPATQVDAVNIADACQSIQVGRVVVSAGLFVEALVNGKYGPGDLVPVQAKTFDVSYDIRCPSWLDARRVRLYENGILSRDQSLETPADRKGTDRKERLTARGHGRSKLPNTTSS